MTDLSPQNRFGRDVFIAALANLARNLRNILLIPLIVGNLSIGHYGEWELLITIIAFLTPWLTFGLSSSIIKFLPGTPLKNIREGFYSIFFFVSCSCFMVVGMLSIGYDLFGFSAEFAFIERNFLAVTSVLVCTILLRIITTYFRAFRRMIWHSSLMLGQHFGEGILLIYFLQEGAPLSLALWSLGCTRGILMLIGLSRIIRDIGIIWPRFEHLSSFLSYSIPLLPNALFYKLYDSADRLFIYTFIGSVAVGKYAAIYLAGSLLTTIVSPFHTVLRPAIAELWNREQREEIGPIIEQTIRFSALITLPTLAAVAILAKPLLDILILQHAVSEVDHYIIISISFAIFGFGIPLGDLLAIAGKVRQLFFLNGALATTNVLLNFTLVPIWGILGAVFSTLICHSTYTITTYFKSQNVIHFSLSILPIIKFLFSTIIASIMLYLMNTTIQYFYSLPIYVLLYSGLVWVTRALDQRDVQFLLNIVPLKRFTSP